MLKSKNLDGSWSNNVKQTSGKLLEARTTNVTTAGTRLQLPGLFCKEVTIVAKKSNSGSIFCGKNNVSSTTYGVELAPNESFTFVVGNTNEIYIDAEVSGEGISYVAV